MAISQIINVIVNSKGAVTVQKQLAAVGDSAKTTATYLNSLRGILAAALTFSGANQIVEVIDNFTALQNRLKLVSDGSQEVATSWTQLMNIANSSYSTIDSTVNLYFRVAQAYKSWGESAQSAMKFTDLFQKSAVLSGSSMQTTSQAVYQFSQALNKGKLDGDEFRSVLEGLPYVANIIQKSLGVTRAELYELSKSGKISVDRLKVAFEEAAKTINSDFAKLTPTIGMALTVLKNNWVDFIGTVQTSTGLFSGFAYLILGIANNFGLLAIALTPVAASLAFLGGRLALGLVVTGFRDMAAVIRTLIPVIIAMNTALWANPYLLIVGLVIALVAAIVYFRNELGLTNEVLLKVWEVTKMVFNYIWGVVTSTVTTIGQLVYIIGDWIIGFLRIKEITVFLGKTLTTMFTVAVASAKAFVSYISKALGPVFQSVINLVKSLVNLFIKIGSILIDDLTPGLKVMHNGFKVLWSYVEPSLKKFVSLLGDIFQGWKNIGSWLAQNFGPIVKAVFEGWIFIIVKVINFIAKLVNMLEKAFALMKAVGGGGGAGSGGGSGGGANYGAQFYAGEYNNGGGFKVPGTGAGRDTTPVAFRANRGERVTVETKRQQRTNDNQAVATNVNVPVAVNNFFDPSMVPAANESSAGQRSITNVIKANREEIARILGVV
jgi:tape measure domain-containing protein